MGTPISRVLCRREAGDDHLSVRAIAGGIKRPTRIPSGQAARALRKVRNSAWSCTGWGLPCRFCRQNRGELLPRHFTLTRLAAGGIFLLRYPSHFCAWTLSSILPCGARTFLPRLRESGHPASRGKVSKILVYSDGLSQKGKRLCASRSFI